MILTVFLTKKFDDESGLHAFFTQLNASLLPFDFDTINADTKNQIKEFKKVEAPQELPQP